MSLFQRSKEKMCASAETGAITSRFGALFKSGSIRVSNLINPAVSGVAFSWWYNGRRRTIKSCRNPPPTHNPGVLCGEEPAGLSQLTSRLWTKLGQICLHNNVKHSAGKFLEFARVNQLHRPGSIRGRCRVRPEKWKRRGETAPDGEKNFPEVLFRRWAINNY